MKGHTTVTTDENGNTRRDVRTEVIMHDKLKALEVLGRHLGIFDPENSDWTKEHELKINIILDKDQTDPRVEFGDQIAKNHEDNLKRLITDAVYEQVEGEQ